MWRGAYADTATETQESQSKEVRYLQKFRERKASHHGRAIIAHVQ
jgi:hypothetical protein